MEHPNSLTEHRVIPKLGYETFLFACSVLAFETGSLVYQKFLEFDMMLRLASNLRSSYPSLLSDGSIALLISGR